MPKYDFLQMFFGEYVHTVIKEHVVPAADDCVMKSVQRYRYISQFCPTVFTFTYIYLIIGGFGPFYCERVTLGREDGKRHHHEWFPEPFMMI